MSIGDDNLTFYGNVQSLITAYLLLYDWSPPLKSRYGVPCPWGLLSIVLPIS